MRSFFHIVYTTSISISLSSSTTAQNSLICQEPDGTYEDARQCDKYYECYDGIPQERLCPDGLVFDPFSRKREPCDHYFNVDCGDRLELRKCATVCVPIITY